MAKVQPETKIFRFKISNEELYQAMIEFASFHKFEDKATLKKNYESWVENSEIQDLIHQEEMFLKSQHYDLEKNNLKTKIFKSIKYYHIKNMLKTMNAEQSNEANKDKKRQKNIIFSRQFVQNVKEFMNENIGKEDFKPSLYYNLFITTHEDIVVREKQTILMKLNEESQEKYTENFENTFDYRLKKMFKNQYFNMFKLQNS